MVEKLKEIGAAGTVYARLPSPADTDEDPASLRARVERLLLNAVNAEGRTGRIELAQAKKLLSEEFPGEPIEKARFSDRTRASRESRCINARQRSRFRNNPSRNDR